MTIVPFPNNPKVALLDWDGTFCDSRESIYGLNLVMADYYQVQMPSYENWLQASHPGVAPCMKSLGVTAPREEINEFFTRLLEEQRESGFQNPLYPGSRALLELFRVMKIPAIVISRHPYRHLCKDILKYGLNTYFSGVYGEPDGVDLEKDVVIHSVCQQLMINHSSAFYLGDTSHDMALAHKAGVCAVAVSHGYDPAVELEKKKPAHIFKDLLSFHEFFAGTVAKSRV